MGQKDFYPEVGKDGTKVLRRRFVIGMEPARNNRWWCLARALALGTALVGCQASRKRNPPLEVVLESQEVSIAQDRSHLENERQGVPKAIARKNDDLAFDLEKMAELRLPPDQIRREFQMKVGKSRKNFRSDLEARRSQFSRRESVEREKFLADLAKERENFKRRRRTSEQSRKYFDEEDIKKRDFNSQQKDERLRFESEMSTVIKDYDSIVQQRIKQFDDQLKIYSTRYYEKKREQRPTKQF